MATKTESAHLRKDILMISLPENGASENVTPKTDAATGPRDERDRGEERRQQLRDAKKQRSAKRRTSSRRGARAKVAITYEMLLAAHKYVTEVGGFEKALKGLKDLKELGQLETTLTTAEREE